MTDFQCVDNDVFCEDMGVDVYGIEDGDVQCMTYSESNNDELLWLCINQ